MDRRFTRADCDIVPVRGRPCRGAGMGIRGCRHQLRHDPFPGRVGASVERDPATIGIANGGTAHSVNHDDGTLNYDDGKISQNVSRFTSDLNINGGALSAFFRVTGFVDWEQRNGTRERTPLTKQALEIVGQDLELLDAYVTGNFNVGEAPAQLRVGQQVLSWGESTFIPNGINVINPIDVAQFRTPGAELRNALKPIPMISGSVSPTESITVEGFYQLAWKEVETDPPGTFFSTNDFVGAGGSRSFWDSATFRISARALGRRFPWLPLTAP